MITVVVGPPCAGKSSYVSENAANGDVVVDFDVLATALGSRRSHDAPAVIKDVAHIARAAVIDAVLDGINADAWIIHSSPKSAWLERYSAAGAEVVEIDPGLDACLERAKEDGRPDWTASAIERWYADRAEKQSAEGRTKSPMLTKNHAIELVAFKAGPDDGLEEGQFTAYASVFGNRDSYGDVVMPGAFAKDLARWEKSGNPIPLLFGHNMSDPDYNIGHIVKAEEDAVGLKITGQLDLENPKARQVYRMLKGRRINQMSFAYDEIESGPATHDGENVWELRELKVYEISVVTIGANSETEILAVKSIPGAVERAMRDVKAGRVLTATNGSELKQAHDAIGLVLAALDSTSDEEKASGTGPSCQDSEASESREASQEPSVDTSALDLLEIELGSSA